MAKSASLGDYRERLAGLPADHFVGSILWFSISGTVERPDGRRTVVPVRVNSDQLEDWFDDLELDRDFLPARIKKIDAFRNASSQARSEYSLTDGKRAQLRVEEVRSDAEQVIRHVMCLIVDSRNEQLSYDHMATLKFIRGGRTARGKRHSGDHWKYQVLHRVKGQDREKVEAFIADISQRYDDLAVNLQSPAIRSVLRQYLSSLNAISMKTSGGVYFVHKERWDVIDRLQELVKRISQGCVLEHFPLVDTDGSRSMLAEAHQAEVEEEIRKLLVEVATVEEKAKARGGRIEPKVYAQLNGRLQEVMTRSEDVAKTVGLAQGRASSAIELALDAVTDMATRLDVKKGTKR